QIEIPNWFSRVWRLLGFLHRLLEFFLQQLRGMLLRFHRLAKNRVAPAVLFFHGASRFFHVVEGFRLDWRSMRYDAARGRVDFHHRAAARTSHVKTRLTRIGFAFHHPRSYRNWPQSASARREANRQNIEQIQHFPTQQNDRHHHHQNRQNLAKAQTPVMFETARPQAQNIQRGEAKHQRPENVVNLPAGRSQKEHSGQNPDRQRAQSTARELYPPVGLPRYNKQR